MISLYLIYAVCIQIVKIIRGDLFAIGIAMPFPYSLLSLCPVLKLYAIFP